MMKTYHVNEKTQKAYKATGYVALIIAFAVVFFNLGSYADLFWQVVFYLMVGYLAALFLKRHKNCKLVTDENILVFDNGLLTRTKIEINKLQRVEYTQGVKIKFYYENGFKKKIPDLFDATQTQEILAFIKHRNKKMQFEEVPSKQPLIKTKKGAS